MGQAKNITLFTGIILMILGIFALVSIFSKSANPVVVQDSAKLAKNISALSSEQLKRIDNDLAFSIGPKNAKVVVVEFLDFKCDFCKESAVTLRRLMAIYKNTSVRFVIRHLPLSDVHPFAMEASRAALCAREQNKFLEMHYALFSHQEKLTSLLFPQLAKNLGLDVVAFNRCYAENKYENLILKDISDAGDIGVTGTPTFFINGNMIQGSIPGVVLEKIINSFEDEEQSL